MRIDPKIDFAFKCLFGSEKNKKLLISLLQAILGIEIHDVVILNPFNGKEKPDGKLSILDIKARLGDGTFINVEMQMTLVAAYPERSMYYWASLYTNQLAEGAEYTDLARTVAIHIIDDVLFPEIPDYHVEFDIRSVKHPQLRLTDRFALHTIELPKVRMKQEQLSTALDGWCYFLSHPEEMKMEEVSTSTLPAMEAIREAKEALKAMFLTDEERQIYEGRLKQARDALWIRKASRKEGLEAGLAEGRVEGRVEGLQLAIKQVIVERFGTSGKAWADRVGSISEPARLNELLSGIIKAASLEEFEKLL